MSPQNSLIRELEHTKKLIEESHHEKVSRPNLMTPSWETPCLPHLTPPGPPPAGAAPDPDGDHAGGERSGPEPEQLAAARVSRGSRQRSRFTSSDWLLCDSLLLLLFTLQPLSAGRHSRLPVPGVGVLHDGQQLRPVRQRPGAAEASEGPHGGAEGRALQGRLLLLLFTPRVI